MPALTRKASSEQSYSRRTHQNGHGNGHVGHNGNGHAKVEAIAPAREQWVCLFSQGNGQMRDLLGGKGANLAE